MALQKSYQLSILCLLLMMSSSFGMDMSIISYNDQHPNQKPSHGRSDEEIMSIFEEWLAEHNKVYNTLGEKQRRFEIFKDKLNYIEDHNAKNKSYKLGLNLFSDLSFEEFSSKYLGAHYVPTSNTTAEYMLEDVAPPDSIDWRSTGAVTPVKNQGDCASCWSFGSIAAVEGLMKIATGNIESLSEQEVIDCIRKDCSGKRGCSQEDAYNYIVQNRGITSSENYPYVAARCECDNEKRKDKVFSINGFAQVKQSEIALKQAVARQPISVDLKVAKDFQDYKNGVYKGKCGSILNHAVGVVGYDTTGEPENEAYWIIKNSWGPNWGEQGYMRLQRNVRSTDGKCGIVLYANYPTKNGVNDESEHNQIY